MGLGVHREAKRKRLVLVDESAKLHVHCKNVLSYRCVAGVACI